MNNSDFIKVRELARKNKDYKLADEIRKYFNEMGIELRDTKDGTKIRKRSLNKLNILTNYDRRKQRPSYRRCHQ